MELNKVIGLGVAGNFAGHLEQAGEAKDFAQVKVADATAPKAIFPFYVPAETAGFLAVFPLSSCRIQTTDSGDNLQIEPEVAILCDLTYRDGLVTALQPVAFAAYNDCSIRKPNARKISEKKNWGPDSKGVGPLLPLDSLLPGGVLDGYRIASFLRRDGELHPYGQDSAVVEYSYFHERLVNWLIDKLNHQQDEGPAEHIAGLLAQAGHPRQALISIGATRYTPFGERHYLQPGDESLVVVYPAADFTPAAVQAALAQGDLNAPGVSLLRQQVV
ncbi:DUF5718 family protein [Pseudaeromonas sp. ZJS20]|uniref:DUF5718 family protein n=1 Tax=Pseudaeromonas aegiceratis TaxID=3153928 RepID=UPI00390C48D4